MLTGGSVIRAFGREELFEDRYLTRLDTENNVFFFTWMMARWYNLRLDMVVVLFSFIVAVIAVTTRQNLAAGAFGSLAVSYSARLGK